MTKNSGNSTRPSPAIPNSDSRRSVPAGRLLPTPRVTWPDPSATLDSRWIRTYTLGGSAWRSIDLLSFVPDEARLALRSQLSQAWFAVYDPRGLVVALDPETAHVTGTLRKILQRGDLAPLDPELEKLLLEQISGFDFESSSLPGDLSFTATPKDPTTLPDELLGAAVRRSSAIRLESRLPYDSDAEKLFHGWMAEELGIEFAMWFHPQAPLEALVSGSKRTYKGTRRVDFLVAIPWARPFVVEIDGEQHRVAESVDRDRDRELLRANLPVLRFSAAEVRRRSKRVIDEVRGLVGEGIPVQATVRAAKLLHGPAFIVRFALALVEAVNRNWLPGASRWIIDLADPLNVVHLAVPSLLRLLASIDELWSGTVAPAEFVIRNGDRAWWWRRRDTLTYEQVSDESTPDEAAHCTIILEPGLGVSAELPPTPIPRTIVVRAPTLPVRLAESRSEGHRRSLLREVDAIPAALTTILRWVFAKEKLREGQHPALTQLLQGRDSVVLLPTGAGKSLVYQLAGLLMPGRTLVIDPIVALIEDQMESLHRAGIDRIVGLSSYVTTQRRSDEAIALIRSADALFIFVAPERLQQKTFREALRSLVTHTPINLVVIDEAHCVSEWGHDFRTSYLNLGRNLRNFCTSDDGRKPPFLALTGTASRAVLSDVLTELALDRTQPGLVIKPQSFGRPELSFIVRTTTPDAQVSSLPDIVRRVASEFGMSLEDFALPRGQNSHLGIVFCPWVDGQFGVATVADELRKLFGDAVGVYAGRAPKSANQETWADAKRDTVSALRDGMLTVLCATKAFGMGIDIPNIRFTVHVGIPGSIESFYQEAGRAGRDQRPARCCVLFSENPQNSALDLLAASTPVENIAAHMRKNRAVDDVSRQMLFHINTFSGPKSELENVRGVLARLAWTGSRCDVHVPFRATGSSTSEVERALHRLTTIGVVADYTVEYGSRRYEVTLSDSGPRDLAGAFLRYVTRAQPSHLSRYSDKVAQIPPMSLTDYALRLVALNLELMYDTIEKARRRALAEMRNLVATRRSDEEIRRRIEDYFREGDLAPQFEHLLANSTVDLSLWVSILRGLSPADEGELRGTSARLLESFPDHAGLLLSRTYAEVLHGRDVTQFYANWQRTVRSVEAEPGTPPQSADSLVAFLRPMLALRNHHWLPLLWEGLHEVPSTDEVHVQRLRDALALTGDSELETAYLLSRLLSARLGQTHVFLSPLLPRPNPR